jgi:hypothetical protein
LFKADRLLRPSSFRNREKADEGEEEMKNQQDNEPDRCCHGNCSSHRCRSATAENAH